MERFTVTPINENGNGMGTKAPSFRNEVMLNVNNYIRRNSKTVPAIPVDAERRKFSLAQLTREALPRLDNYRISKRALKRPSLGELHGDPEQKITIPTDKDEPKSSVSHIKLGWIQGVLIPCLLNIWGVMLFLRLAWVVGQSGILQTLVIIGISYLVCIITTLSLSAICTNGDVKGGGIYYIISRSLGPEFGASVGIVFAFANAVAASMNTIGFCDSLNQLLKQEFNTKIIDNGVMDTRIVGTIALVIMIIICAVGMEWEAKAQNFLVVAIIIAILSFIIGIMMGPKTQEEKAKGFIGLSGDVFAGNFFSDYGYSEGVDQTFFSVFAIFFPSVTGIQAGANICGDLKDPASAIPKGTLLALLLSGISYVAFVLFAGGSAIRDASGNVTEMLLNNGSYSCAMTNTCEYGLSHSYTIMNLMAAWGPLIYVGCFAATLSTALTNLLSVPRLIQALGIDRIYPGLIYFSKGYGKHGEPYRGYVLTLIISVAFLLIAQLNLIAPLISTFYLASYALINFCTFHAALVKPLGWRPTFHYYNLWLSLFGCVLCVAIMFLIDWQSALITIIIIFALYLLVMYRKPDVNWGSSTQAQTYKTALASAHQLQRITDHVKNYHPQVLVLAGKPYHRPPLVDLANLITKHNSLMIVGDVVPERISYRRRMTMIKEATHWFEVNKIKAFYNVVDGVNLEEGVRGLVQATGFGKLAPNIMLMGYKPDWSTCNSTDLLQYFNILHNAFDQRMAVAILRLPNGVDYSHIIPEFFMDSPVGALSAANSTVNLDVYSTIGALPTKPKLMHADSNLNIESLDHSHNPNLTFTSTQSQISPVERLKQEQIRAQHHNKIVYSTRGGSSVPKELLDTLGVFNKKQKKGTIDVWWLYDDGGLTMLLPYIISTRSNWSNCKIRVFALTNHRQELETEERNMANLLAKLRIDYSSLTMVQGVTEKPQAATIEMHNQLLNGFLEGQREDNFISNIERSTLQMKTYRQLRLREMLMEHSKNANMVVMSLPMPRQGTVSAPLYMSWLEILTKDMPPMLLVRGNQTSVLTFYS